MRGEGNLLVLVLREVEVAAPGGQVREAVGVASRPILYLVHLHTLPQNQDELNWSGWSGKWPERNGKQNVAFDSAKGHTRLHRISERMTGLLYLIRNKSYLEILEDN